MSPQEYCDRLASATTTAVAKFRTTPVAIEAVQWSGYNWDAVCELMGIVGLARKMSPGISPFTYTSERGEMIVDIGDWIIKAPNGEMSVCKPDLFAKTHQPAADFTCQCPMCEHHTTAHATTAKERQG